MWTKTLTVNFKGLHTVALWYDTTNDDGTECVQVKSMINEWHVQEEIHFQSRDAAYDFIKHYSVAMAKAFVIREGYNASAFN